MDEAVATLAEARAALPEDALAWLISARLSRRLERLGEAQAQIETVAGVHACAEIAAVDGIDVLFVGPADLQHDLGRLGAAAPFDYAACLKTVAEAAHAAGKAAGILLRDAADLARHRELGYGHIAVDSDLSILRKAWTGSVAVARG